MASIQKVHGISVGRALLIPAQNGKRKKVHLPSEEIMLRRLATAGFMANRDEAEIIGHFVYEISSTTTSGIGIASKWSMNLFNNDLRYNPDAVSRLIREFGKVVDIIVPDKTVAKDAKELVGDIRKYGRSLLRH